MTDEPAIIQSRRRFLTGTAAAGAGLVAAGAARAATPDPLITEVQDWASATGDAVDAHPYGMPIKYENHVVRGYVEWLTESPISSINFTPIHALEGTITPQGCAFERHHSGAIEMTKGDYRLMINGLVEKPLVFTFEDLMRFPRRTMTAFCECAANGGMEWGGAQLEGCQYTQGMIHNMEYTGVMLKDLLAEAGVKPEGKWIYAEGHDASSNGRSMPLEKALDDVMVAFFANGEALRKEHGYPVRLVVPGFEGNMWIKWLRRIGVYHAAVESREETSKYTDLMPGGKARKWTWVMDAKSVITAPSPQVPIRHGKGPLVITGLAWSGHGKIKRVDVSVDGGKTWAEARLASEPQSKALTRFHYDMDWDGSEMFIMSRAMDETGYVQPTKEQLRAIRGTNNVYHNNAIQPWWVHANGEVENVEIV
jgi:sulfane dehydrogenase subunit SoxC